MIQRAMPMWWMAGWAGVLVGVVCVTAVHAWATTWHVEQDGSGGFTTIQAAVDAAADGDGIAIGPGHYNDLMTYQSWETCVLLDGSKSLSFVGAGPDATIIGPESSQIEDNTLGFILVMTSEAYSVSLDGLGIVNSFYGLNARGSHVQVTNCHFDHCFFGLYIGTHSNGSLTVTDCTFQGMPLAGVPTAILSGAQWSAIERVEMHGWSTGIQLANNGGSDALIADCVIDGGEIGRTGVAITDGPSATVRNCIIRNHQVYSLALADAGTVVLHDNLLEECGFAGVDLDGCSSFTMVDNIIQSSESCFYLAYPCDVQSIHGNHFLRDMANDGYYVKTPDYFPWGPHYEDFTMNYWGTTDVDEISQWILDGYDQQYCQLYIVFEPIADGPVAVESHTWTEVKSLFRGDAR